MHLFETKIAVAKAAELFGVTEAWIRGRSGVNGDVITFGQALKAAEGFPRDEAGEHKRLRRLRAER